MKLCNLLINIVWVGTVIYGQDTTPAVEISVLRNYKPKGSPVNSDRCHKNNWQCSSVQRFYPVQANRQMGWRVLLDIEIMNAYYWSDAPLSCFRKGSSHMQHPDRQPVQASAQPGMKSWPTMTARVFWRDLVRDAQFILKTEGSAEVARICRANLVAVHIYQAGQREAFLRHCQREIEEATPAPTYFCLISSSFI